MLPGIMSFVGYGSAITPLVLTFRSDAWADAVSNLTTYTSGSISIGSATADRYVVALIAGEDGSTNGIPDSVDFAGVSLTKVAEAGTLIAVSIWIGNVTSGTSGTLSATFPGATQISAASVYTLRGDLAAVTASDTLTATTNDPSGSIDFFEGGAVIAVAYNSTSASVTWTGVTSDSGGAIFNSVPAVTATVSYASDAPTVTELNKTVTANFDANSSDRLAVASWKPAGS